LGIFKIKLSNIKNDVLCNVLNEIGSIECTLLFCHNKWGGLVVKELISIFGVQRSIPTNDMVVINDEMLIEYFLFT
jgi:hypothetical protein